TLHDPRNPLDGPPVVLRSCFFAVTRQVPLSTSPLARPRARSRTPPPSPPTSSSERGGWQRPVPPQEELEGDGGIGRSRGRTAARGGRQPRVTGRWPWRSGRL